MKPAHSSQKGSTLRMLNERQKKAAVGFSKNTFNHTADRFVEKSQKEGKSPGTLKKLQWLLADARSDFGDSPIDQITSQHVLKTLKKREAAEHYETARRMRSRIGGVFRYAVANGLAETDPTFALQGP